MQEDVETSNNLLNIYIYIYIYIYVYIGLVSGSSEYSNETHSSTKCCICSFNSSAILLQFGFALNWTEKLVKKLEKRYPYCTRFSDAQKTTTKTNNLIDDRNLDLQSTNHVTRKVSPRKAIFKAPRPVPRPTKSPTQWKAGAVSPGLKQPGSEYAHLFPSSADVKNEWSYTSNIHMPS